MNNAPKFRKGKVADLAHGAAELVAALVAENRDALPSCISCAMFMEQHAYCNHWKGNPPPRIIVNACEHYRDTDEIPF